MPCSFAPNGPLGVTKKDKSTENYIQKLDDAISAAVKVVKERAEKTYSSIVAYETHIEGEVLNESNISRILFEGRLRRGNPESG